MPIEADVLAFYIYRRNIEDLAEFVAQLTRSSMDEADRRAGLGYVADLLDEGPLLDDRVAAIRHVLRDRT